MYLRFTVSPDHDHTRDLPMDLHGPRGSATAPTPIQRPSCRVPLGKLNCPAVQWIKPGW